MKTGKEGSFGAIVSEVTASARQVMQSEVRLAKAEIAEAGTQAGRHLRQAVAYGMIAALGVFPFVAFLILGLGDLLGKRYWLSSLLVAAVFLLIGGALALREIRRTKASGLSLPKTRETLNRQAEIVGSALEKERAA